MKLADIVKIQEAGLITREQREQIVRHFKLKEPGNRFLAIISFVGAVLVACGIILLIAANWDDIPRGIKIGAALALMLGAHAGGWYLREIRGDQKIAGEALHLVGTGLFLGNIALLGQIYNLSSRAPNAILLWVLGIAAFPWLLRSKAQHLVTLLAFGLWFGMEINEPGSLIYFGGGAQIILLFALLGLAFLGLGYWLRQTRFSEFAEITEKTGLFGFLAFFFPTAWEISYRSHHLGTPLSTWILPVMCGLGFLAMVAGVRQLRSLSGQWRWTWGVTLAAAIALLAGAYYLSPETFSAAQGGLSGYSHKYYAWVCSVGLFALCLVQIQVGLQRRQEYMVNLGVGFIALDIFATYLNLFGSMATTGLMFVVSGAFLIGFGVYLEKKRRRLLQQMNEPPGTPDTVTAAALANLNQ
jgi:uncharacterized membrane protein